MLSFTNKDPKIRKGRRIKWICYFRLGGFKEKIKNKSSSCWRSDDWSRAAPSGCCLGASVKGRDLDDDNKKLLEERIES